MKSTITALATLAAAVSSGSAAIVLSGDFNDGIPTPTLTFTEDIVLTITTDSNAGSLVFDEWAITDGSQTSVVDSPEQLIAYELNGSDATVDLTGLFDHLNFTSNDITPNDGLLDFSLFSGIAVTSGDIVTITAGSYTFTSSPDFNPALGDITFTGDIFLIDFGGNRISEIVAVPEPSALLLCTIGSIAMLRRRRNK